MLINSNEGKTIAAISTAYGEGGIGIVRMSGDESFRILKKIFRSVKFDDINKEIEFKNRCLHYGSVIDPDNNRIIDDVLVVYMKAPHTYTKEDVVEIHCHGSVVSLRKILELVLRDGAVAAEPGEFTKRAFLGGRIDLTQAEAVIDVIKAKTDAGFDLAVDQMEGSLSKTVNELRDELLGLIANVIVDIDYPDEDREHVRNLDIKSGLEKLLTKIEKLIESSSAGRFIREGIDTVIAGKPNVGKSSLMNELLRESRAIVTEIPGTTRDTIEETVSIRGIPVKLTDTAGIRNTENKVEQIGIEKTKSAFNRADLIILLLDGSIGIDENDIDIASKVGDKHCFIVVNKTDLGTKIENEEIKALVPGAEIIKMSITEGTGIYELEQKIIDMVYGGNLIQSESMMITNVRHRDLLIRAADDIKQAIEMINLGEALDFVHINMNSAFENMGEITGETVTEDILDRVFSEFCVGK